MTQPTVPEIPERYLKDGEFWGLTWNQQDQALRELAKAERELAEARAQLCLTQKALEIACDDGWANGPTAYDIYMDKAIAALNPPAQTGGKI